MNAKCHEQSHAFGLEKGRVDISSDPTKKVLAKATAETVPDDDVDDESLGEGWDVFTLTINGEEFDMPVSSEQLGAMIAACEAGMAPEPCFDDIKLWIDRHWEDVQDCLDAIADSKTERIDQIRRAAVALAQWQLWRKPEKPDEKFPKEYCDIVGIDNTSTYLDACRQIKEDLEELDKHFEMVQSYERCVGDAIYDEDGNVTSRCWYNPQ